MNRSKKKRIWAVLIIALIFVAWILGTIRSETNLVPYIQQALPDVHHIVKVEEGLYNAWADKAEVTLSGHIALGRANGYGGPLTAAVAIDPSGKIIHAVIADHKETPAWISRVLKGNLLTSLGGKSYTDPFKTGSDIDSVTGATTTSKAIAEAVANGSRVAARYLGLPVKPLKSPDLIFGIPEIVLLALLITGYLGHHKKLRFKRQIRWGSMLAGMIVIGFIYNNPLTLVHVSKLIMGYLPRWQTGLYWYILTIGIFIIFILEGKNTYCGWFCPFGAAQECMGLISGIKLQRPKGHDTLKIMQRTLALGAVLLGLYFRNPGITNYELYGSLFSLVGTSIQFAALGLVLIAAMFLRRPWCSYLCPIKPVLEIMHVFRSWIKEIWKTRSPSSKKL